MSGFLGPYRILRLIGRGGQGLVYLALDERLHRPVAIKLVTAPAEREQQQALLREARIIAELDNPKIVAIYDVIESPDHIAMVMEYVSGCSLADLLAATLPSLGGALTIALDITAALAAAREQRIVHGDLKASNVLITRSGRAKLTDFGIARFTADPRVAGATPAILSPEQHAELAASEQADLFALGLLLSRMLDGVEAAPVNPVNNELPESVALLIQSLLSTDPRRRPQSTRYIRQILRGSLRELPLAVQYSLRDEAAAYFRDESAHAMPTQLPGGLYDKGRSVLHPGDGLADRARFWWRALPTADRIFMATAAFAFSTFLGVLAYRESATTVRFTEPVVEYNGQASLPDGLDGQWLINSVRSALRRELGGVRVLGRVGAETMPPMRSQLPRHVPVFYPDHEMSIALRCADTFCVIALGRASRLDRAHTQLVVFRGQQERELRHSVEGAVRDLF